MFGRSSVLLLGYTSLITNETTFLVPLDGVSSRWDINQYIVTILPSLTSMSFSSSSKGYTHYISPKGKDLTSVLHFDDECHHETGPIKSSSSSSSSCMSSNSTHSCCSCTISDGTHRVAIELIEKDGGEGGKYNNITFTHYRVRSIDKHPEKLIWIDLHFTEDGKYKFICIYIYIYISLHT